MIIQYNNRLAIPANLLYESANLISYDYYKVLCRRGKFTKLREGKGKGNSALLDFELLPFEFREKIAALYPQPKKTAESNAFKQFILEDYQAISFFGQCTDAEGNTIPTETRQRHANEAAILNAFRRKIDGVNKHRSAGASLRGFWQRAVAVLDGLQADWPHKLPKTEKRLRDKYDRYQQHGYASLLKGWNNKNAQVVNEDMEGLFRSIFCQYFKPTVADTSRDYADFLAGKTTLVNQATGEVYDRQGYAPVSEGTIRRYLNEWETKIITHSRRSNSRIAFNSRHRAYASLTVEHSGSLLSLDDRDLPWKMHNGKRAIAYIAADVHSECFVGWAFTKPPTRENDTLHGKNMRLVNMMFQNLFTQLDHYGVPMPAEAEVENHLMSNLKETTLKEGNLFRFVRFAAPENPQEKAIEGFFKRLRYDQDKKQNGGKGWLPRPKAGAEANQGRMEEDEKHTYDYEEIIAMAEDSMVQWNMDLHPDQAKYAGMSRLDVFLSAQHPQLQPINWREVARWVGNCTTTSVNRYELRCNNALWRLPSPELAGRTGNEGQELQAYWLENAAGMVEKIYLYKGDRFLCEALPKAVAHKARIEQTEADLKILGEHKRYNDRINRTIKEGKQELQKIAIISNGTVEQHTPQTVETLPDAPDEINYYDLNTGTGERSLLDDL